MLVRLKCFGISAQQMERLREGVRSPLRTRIYCLGLRCVRHGFVQAAQLHLQPTQVEQKPRVPGVDFETRLVMSSGLRRVTTNRLSVAPESQLDIRHPRG